MKKINKVIIAVMSAVALMAMIIMPASAVSCNSDNVVYYGVYTSGNCAASENTDIGSVIQNCLPQYGSGYVPPSEDSDTPTGDIQLPDTDAETGNETLTDTNSALSEFEQRVVELVNKERAAYGLSELTADESLSSVARAKSQDMSDNGYFSHTSPTYGSPFDMMKSFGISYKTAGENIAMGYTTPEAVVEGWMNSEGHRANILNSSFTHIGVGYVSSGNYWTQMFVGR